MIMYGIPLSVHNACISIFISVDCQICHIPQKHHKIYPETLMEWIYFLDSYIVTKKFPISITLEGITKFSREEQYKKVTFLPGI
jgi:hypothetical protein